MCPKIYVEPNVPIPEGVGFSLQQDLDFAIKIGIEIDETVDINQCHFLQFITHQRPDMFAQKMNEKICWDASGADCTYDLNKPRWKVDSQSYPNPFYEEEGACIIDKKTCCIFDKPQLYPLYERVSAVTFVIANNQVIGEVLWSRQLEHIENRPKEEAFYTYHYEIYSINQLPDWAIYTLQDRYKTNSGYKDQVYDIPPYINKAPTQSPEDAIIESKRCILPAPKMWILLHHEQYKQLVQPPQLSITSYSRHSFWNTNGEWNRFCGSNNQSTESENLCKAPTADSESWNNLPSSNKKSNSGPGHNY